MRTLTRAIYLVQALGTGTFWFCWFVVVFASGLGLAITFLGLPLLLLGLWSVRWFAEVERTLVRSLIGVDVQASYRRPDAMGWWPPIRVRIGDPQTWKDFIYLLMQFPFGIVTATVTLVLLLVPAGMILAPTYGWAIEGGVEIGVFAADSPLEYVLMVAAGFPLAWVGWKLVGALGRVQGAWAQLMLHSTPDPELAAQVTDSRAAQARIVAAADAERRRLERDLHDGAQQRLVSLSLKLAMASKRLDGADETTRTLVAEAHAESKAAVAELRDLARGIHPAILTDRGLGPALDELAARTLVPTDILDVPEQRFSPTLESTVYFVVTEALTNVGKYARASQASVRVLAQPGRLVVEVRDDGRGGADPANGTGLRGLADRVTALEGRFEVDSTPGWGTRVRAELPVQT